MSSIFEIEKAIEGLPAAEIDELAVWLEAYRAQRTVPTQVDEWFKHARGLLAAESLRPS